MLRCLRIGLANTEGFSAITLRRFIARLLLCREQDIVKKNFCIISKTAFLEPCIKGQLTPSSQGCVLSYVPSSMWRPKVNQCSVSSTMMLRIIMFTDCLTAAGDHQSIRLASTLWRGSGLCPTPASTGVTDTCDHSHGFSGCWGSKLRSAGIAQHALYP